MNFDFVTRLRSSIANAVLGQRDAIDRLLIGLLIDGHVLFEGVPGLAKTLMATAFANSLGLQFSRIQFTVDLLPGDILGSEIFNRQSGKFEFREGPLFANIVLADEINRAPARSQSALLEVMQERRITVGAFAKSVGDPFFVIATQNPIEHMGTFELPEAQLDRFVIYHRMSYPNSGDERKLLRLQVPAEGDPDQSSVGFDAVANIKAVPNAVKELSLAKEDVRRVHVNDVIVDKILRIVKQTRIAGQFEVACGPRAGISLCKAVQAYAFIKRRAFVVPQDIRELWRDVLLHRVRTSAAGSDSADIILERIVDDIIFDS